MKKARYLYSIIFLVGVLVFLPFLISVAQELKTPWPSVKVDINPSAALIQPGQEITLMARSFNYSLEGQDDDKMHFNWCIDNIPLHGLIAGSNDKIMGKEGEYHLENRFGKVSGGQGACQIDDFNVEPTSKTTTTVPIPGKVRKFIPRSIRKLFEETTWSHVPPEEIFIFRTPNVDTDGDGLDDEWEIRFFGGRRKLGTKEYYPSADNKAALLAAVKPDDDPDKDGWEYPYIDAIDYDAGQTPWYKELGYGFWGKAWTIGVPYVSGNEIGDKKFTNLEEYTFGTDPLSPDTDQDGILDEADVAGNQQDQFTIRIGKDWGGKYKMNLHAFGVTQRWREKEDKKKYADWKYFRADFPLKKEIEGVDKTPEGENILAIGQGLPMQLKMSYNPAPVIPGDNVEVVVEAAQLREFKGLSLFFRWFLDGKEQASKEEIEGAETREGEGLEQTGFNKKIFKFPVTKRTCDVHIVGVEVIEEKTGKITFDEMEIPVGFAIEFEKEILGNADLTNPDVSEFNLKEGSTKKIEDLLFPKTSDIFKDEIDGNIGFRNGDAVRIKAFDFEEGFDPALCKKDSLEEFLKSLTFNWTYNDIEQVARSGKGPAFQTFEAILHGVLRAPKESSGDAAESVMETGSNWVNLEVLNEKGEVIVRKREEFKIIPPYVEFEVEGAEIVSARKDSSQVQYQAKEGDDIKVTANVHYLRPTEGINYVWKRNGTEVSEAKNIISKTSSYSFKAGLTPEGKSTKSRVEEISLAVENNLPVSAATEGQTQVPKEWVSGQIQIKIIREEGAPTGVGAVGGFLQKFIPSYFKSVFNLALSAGLIALIVLFVLGLVSGVGAGERKR